MINTHYREKLINAIVYFAANTEFCGKTKLMKLLYFLDFKHFKETGKSVTGMQYDAWEMGPVPVPVFDELSGAMKPDFAVAIRTVVHNELQRIIPRQKFDGKYFTKREKRILENLAFIFKDAQADDMIESTHLYNSPWYITKKEKGLKQRIDYFLALDDSPESLSYQDAHDRVRERHEMYRALGAKK